MISGSNNPRGTRWTHCPECDGTGGFVDWFAYDFWSAGEECGECGGTGTVRATTPDFGVEVIGISKEPDHGKA